MCLLCVSYPRLSHSMYFSLRVYVFYICPIPCIPFRVSHSMYNSLRMCVSLICIPSRVSFCMYIPYVYLLCVSHSVYPILCILFHISHSMYDSFRVCESPMCIPFCVSRFLCILLCLCFTPCVFHSVCVPIRVCSNPCVFHSVCVPLGMCPTLRVSLPPCVPFSVCTPLDVCPTPCVFHSCISDSIYPTPYTFDSLCLSILSCLPFLCAPLRVCLSLRVSFPPCVLPSVCLSLRVSPSFMCPSFRVSIPPCVPYSIYVQLPCVFHSCVSNSVCPTPYPFHFLCLSILSCLQFLCLPLRVSIPHRVCIRFYISLLVRPTPYIPTLCVTFMCPIPSVFPSPSLPHLISHSLCLLIPTHFRKISHSLCISYSL